MKWYIALLNSTNQKAPFFVCSVGLSYNDPGYHIVKKQRNTSEFEYILKGSGTVICNGKEYRVKAGDAFYLRRGCDSELITDKSDPWTKIHINVFGDLIPYVMEAYKLNEKVLFPQAPCYVFFKKMMNVCRTKGITLEEKNTQLSLLVYELIQNLYEHSNNINSPAPLNSKKNEAHLIKVYMDNHINENITMDELAALVYRSISQTTRIFKQTYGMTPYNYLMNMRITSAKQLLEQTNLSIKEISFQLGFADEHYFSHFFKSKTGKSPTSYRKNNI